MTFEHAVIIHGYGASPKSHWFASTARHLEARGTRVDVPAMPNTEHPVAGEWTDAVRRSIGRPDDGTVVVTHSLGGIAALAALDAIPGSWRLGGLITVAGFLEAIPALPELDGFIGALHPDTGRARLRTRRIGVLRSDDDAIVPAARSDALARVLGVVPLVVHGAGHFLDRQGFRRLPVLERLLDAFADELARSVDLAGRRVGLG